MRNKIESIDDIIKNIIGFAFGTLGDFPSDPAAAQWKSGCKAYEWSKKDIQKLHPGKYSVDEVFGKKLSGVYIIGKNFSVFVNDIFNASYFNSNCRNKFFLFFYK